jgi:hypothetical protein
MLAVMAPQKTPEPSKSREGAHDGEMSLFDEPLRVPAGHLYEANREMYLHPR